MKGWLYVQIGTYKDGPIDLLNVDIATMKRAIAIFNIIKKMDRGFKVQGGA